MDELLGLHTYVCVEARSITLRTLHIHTYSEVPSCMLTFKVWMSSPGFLVLVVQWCKS